MSARGATKVARVRAPEHFGPLLRRLRERRGLLQSTVSQRSSVRGIAEIERLTQPPPNGDGVRRIMRTLHDEARLDDGERIDLIAAASFDRCELDLDGLTLEQVRELVEYAERLKSRKGARAA